MAGDAALGSGDRDQAHGSDHAVPGRLRVGRDPFPGRAVIGALGGVGVLPPTLLLQYHFNNAGKVRPYVGAGINYTLFYNNGLHAGDQPVSIENHSWGPALQFGIDFQVSKNVFVNADIKKIWMHTDASMAGTPLGTLHIDPIVVGLGVGMKF